MKTTKKSTTTVAKAAKNTPVAVAVSAPKGKKLAKVATAAPVAVAAPSAPAAIETPASVPASKRMFRPGTQVERLYNVLKDGVEHTVAEMHAAMTATDKNQILTDLRRVGKKSGEFRIDLAGPATYKLVSLPS